MKHTFTIIIFILAIPIFAISQTISGFVKESTNTPIHYATVVLFSQNDSSYVAGTVTDSLGYFLLESSNFNLNTKYFLRISSIGYITKYAPTTPNQTIILEEDTLLLDEITLKAKLPISKITADGVQTNVAHTILADMGTGNDVLKRIPILSGDDGVYEVFGRGEAKIYVNGREVRDATEIERINSKDIKNVEVITNPSARYDASVAAVINITTIKKQGDGFSINARASVYTWEAQHYMPQVNMNYRYKGLDLFANVNYSHGTGLHRGLLTTTNNVDTVWLQNTYIDATFKSVDLYTAVGLNYDINQKHSVGFRYDLTTQPSNGVQNTLYSTEIFADDVVYDNWENTERREGYSSPKSEINIYYKGEVANLGIDFNNTYLGFDNNTWSEYIEKSVLFGEDTIRSTNYSKSTLWASKLQLSYPLWKGKIMAGVEYVSTYVNDDYTNYDLPDYSSNVEIAEQNISVYLQYQAQTKGGNFSLGLRYENAAYEYYDDGILSNDMSKVYNQLFPSASYSINIKDVGIQLAYTSKVQRPTYDELRSNVYYANRYLLQSGNPYLTPSINNNFAVMGVWRFVQASVSYLYQTNAIQRWMEQYEEDPKIIFINYINLDETHRISAHVAIAPKIKFWQPQWSIGVQKAWFDFEKYEMSDIVNTPIVMASWSNAFNLPYDILINLDANFQSSGSYMTMYVPINRYILNFAFSKSFLKKSLQAKIGIDDVFYNNKNAAKAIFPNITTYQNYEYDSRKVYVTLSYFFNQTESKYKGTSAGEDAKRRL